jgi:aryl sulfotransferase
MPVYFNHQLDSRRWDEIEFRPGDIVVATSPKVGTTWTWWIIATLIHGEHLPPPPPPLVPWPEQRFGPPIDVVKQWLSAQKHRRVMRSHLPFDALPYHRDAFYVCTGRDGRDVALSLHNHLTSFTEETLEKLNSPPGTFPPLEVPGPDVHAFIKGWLTKGNPLFPWETDGYPHFSFFRQVRTFWDQRALPNVLLVNYADLTTDLAGEARRIARFLGIEPTPERIEAVQRACTFDAMREVAARPESGLSKVLKGGAATFFHKGVAGRGRAFFTSEEQALYEAALTRNLSTPCARWLDEGRLATGIDPATSPE